MIESPFGFPPDFPYTYWAEVDTEPKTGDENVVKKAQNIPARSRLRCGFIGSRVVAVVDGEIAGDFESSARLQSGFLSSTVVPNSLAEAVA
jgi:hypothetical protein